jgi:hypothetical protein
MVKLFKGTARVADLYDRNDRLIDPRRRRFHTEEYSWIAASDEADAVTKVGRRISSVGQTHQGINVARRIS